MQSFVAVLALGLALPGHAVAHEGPRAAMPDARADAEQLVGVLLPRDAILALGGRAFDYGVDQGNATDPQERKLYDAHPGMKEYVAGKVRPEFQTIMLRELPRLRQDLGTILIAEMTPAEIADALAFFASPTGIKIKAQVYQSIGDRPDRPQAEIQESATAAAIANLTPDDYPALMAFGATTAAQKMQAVVNQKISVASQEWAARMVSANQARLRQIAVNAQAEFLAKSK
ncbi:DUF2059 domain-containing protein [Sphingomonas sp. dw_22]|uniref:DUF2059 domain-containing protein n=1 Tax=Sphingomonas sp. dw_22 TaxID=2721175 RepID=UPI001BD3FC47|nr:DUF2059 domain-containing protein [Sphingomonas sp. dw_22]